MSTLLWSIHLLSQICMLPKAGYTSTLDTFNTLLHALTKLRVSVIVLTNHHFSNLQLDTADRYLNCKCCRYLIRAGEVEKAEKMAEQFTRENTTVQENLKEMQVLWFQIECAQAYYRQGTIVKDVI